MPRGLEEMGCETRMSWRPGHEVENAEHGDKSVRRSCRLSACSISHPTHCQDGIVRTAAVSPVVNDWEATWGMHESIKILWEQVGPFKQEMVWALTYVGRLQSYDTEPLFS